jgi:hypothetical protein
MLLAESLGWMGMTALTASFVLAWLTGWIAGYYGK